MELLTVQSIAWLCLPMQVSGQLEQADVLCSLLDAPSISMAVAVSSSSLPRAALQLAARLDHTQGAAAVDKVGAGGTLLSIACSYTTDAGFG